MTEGRSLKATLDDPRTRQETVKTEELPAIPSSGDPDTGELQRMRSDAFKTIQFDASQVRGSIKEVLPISDAEIGIRKACESALIVVLESLNRIEKTPAYRDKETVSIYRKDFVQLLGILRDGELGTRGLIFHLEQKCQFLESMMMEFPNAICIEDLRQSHKVCKESKAKLEEKLRR